MRVGRRKETAATRGTECQGRVFSKMGDEAYLCPGDRIKVQ